MFLLLAPSAATGDEQTEKFIRDTIANARTDGERARKLVDTARASKKKPALQVVLLERALQYGMKVQAGKKDSRIAWQILDDLDKAAPERREEWASRRADLHRLAYQQADDPKEKRKAADTLVQFLRTRGAELEKAEDFAGAATAYAEACAVATTQDLPVKGALADLAARAKILTAAARKAQGYRDVLNSNPGNVSVREALLAVLTVDLDNPNAAAKCLAEGVGESWTSNLPLAAADPQSLPAPACLALGDWFSQLARQASSPYGKANALYRATFYNRQFLKRGPDVEADAKARAAQEEILKELQTIAERSIRPLARCGPLPALPPSPVVASRPGGGNWIDLIQSVNLPEHLVRGQWRKESASLICEATYGPNDRLLGEARILIPLSPQGSYELSAYITRTSGTAALGVILPAGDFDVALRLSDQNGEAHVLYNVDGQRDEKSACLPGLLETGKEYLLNVRISLKDARAEILAKLDDKEFIRWTGLTASLSNPMDLPEPGGFGLFANTPAKFRQVRYRELPNEPSAWTGKNVDELIRDVRASISNDAERSGIFYAAARNSGQDAGRKRTLMQAAAEYAVQGVASPASLEVALKALHFLGKDSPEKAQQWTAMETDACRKAYAQASAPPFKHRAATLLVSRLAKTAEADGTAGHWARSEETLREAVGVGAALSLQNTLLIRARHARAKVLAPADKKAQNLADALKSQPDNVTARMDLLRLLVVELDAPAEAARHLGGAFDEVWRTYVPMAAQPVKELNETACWELGQWYYKALLKLAETPEARLSVLRRAKTYYERFSELHAAQDAQTAGVKVALTAIREELDAAKDSPVGTIVPGQWIPLMPEAHRLVGWNVPQELKPGEKVLYDGYTLELASTEGLVVDFPLDARDVVLRAVVRLMQSGTLQLRVRTGQKGAFFGEFFGGNSFQLTWWNSDTQEREVLAEKQTLRTYKSSFELMLVATGTTLALYADGEKVLQVQDKRRVSGSVGLKVVDGRAQFEDVMILIPDKGWKLK